MLSDLPTLQSNAVAEKLLATSKQHRKTEATKEEFSKPQDHMQMERNLRETQLKQQPSVAYSSTAHQH